MPYLIEESTLKWRYMVVWEQTEHAILVCRYMKCSQEITCEMRHIHHVEKDTRWNDNASLTWHTQNYVWIRDDVKTTFFCGNALSSHNVHGWQKDRHWKCENRLPERILVRVIFRIQTPMFTVHLAGQMGQESSLEPLLEVYQFYSSFTESPFLTS